ncbi:hypothetical protein JR316_0002171 [Psilocybe cubensis]|uniref:Uncharacterized protein n=2 Tax=Psilocybe cubensis TaxID=181762 RepID=A0ACB8HC54_PSICU|nr:hypothetical protein JR316_0002171 [Psilocybe cubensis]KAH9485264.1 hypothetical protein JR316_0002171 [Psilocybe cubensis]
MATYTSTLTPRRRMVRNPLANFDRSGQTVSTSEPGPSRLPELSQIIDVNLSDMSMSHTTDHTTRSSALIAPTVTRSEATPAEKLRALLNVLPHEVTSTARVPSSPKQYLSERDSDYDITGPASATKSIAQESVRNLFSNARRDPDTPQKSISMHNGADHSDVEPTHRYVRDRKGKQKSLHNDSSELQDQTPHLSRMSTRSKAPVTMEFLRERFSDSVVSPEDAELPDTSTNRVGNQTFLRDLDAYGHSPPIGTSTPQQSLRMSFNSQFHSNLLESDTEMQDAIDGLGEYDEVTNHRSVSPPPTIRKGYKSLLDKQNASHPRQQFDSGHYLHITSPQSKTRSIYSQEEQNEVDAVEKSLKSDFDRDQSRHERRQFKCDQANEEEELDEVEDSLKTDYEWNKSQSRDQYQGHENQAVEQAEIDEVEISLKTDMEWDQSRSRHEPLYSRSNSHQHQSTTLSSMELTGPLGEPAAFTHNKRASRFLNEDSYRNDKDGEDKEWPSPKYGHRASSYTEPHIQSVTDLDKPFAENTNDQHHVWSSPSNLVSGQQSTLTPRPFSTVQSKKLGDFDKIHNPTSEDYNSFGRMSPLSSRTVNDISKELSRPPSRTSSLHAIENTYLNERTSTRSPPVLTSPITPPVTNNQRFKSATPSSSKLYATPSVPRDIIDTPTRSLPTPSAANPFHDSGTKFASTPLREQSPTIPNHQTSESYMEQKKCKEGSEFDDLRETDFSSRGDTPEVSQVHGHSSDFVSWSSVKQTPRLASTPLIKNDTHQPSPEPSVSSSTPPRPPSRSSRREYETPSPPKALPDLPTPSSSDESNRSASRTNPTPLRIQKTPQKSTWLQTPRPPGAWTQTPELSRYPSSDSESDIHSQNRIARNGKQRDSADSRPLYSQTPTNRNNRVNSDVLNTISKTPMPPGSWLSTPVPILNPDTRAKVSDFPEKKIGLRTPMTSVSKGLTLESQTPGVPGGWLNTPATRKSILKVRFDASHIDDLFPHQDNFDSAMQAEHEAIPPLSPSIPRKSKGPNIRVVDAFGREQDTIESKSTERSQSKPRVIDAMAKSIDQSYESQTENSADEMHFTSRNELLRHIRHGLDDLIEEFDDQVQYGPEPDADRVRIEELNTISSQARNAREQLQNRSAHSKVALARMSKPFSATLWFTNRRLWCTVALINLIFVIIMFRYVTIFTCERAVAYTVNRISDYWARQRYLNSYFDPFNPELYLYLSNSDHSLYLLDDDLSRTSWTSYARTLLIGGRTSWYNWLQVTRELPSYLWSMWASDPTESLTPQNGSTWLPS